MHREKCRIGMGSAVRRPTSSRQGNSILRKVIRSKPSRGNSESGKAPSADGSGNTGKGGLRRSCQYRGKMLRKWKNPIREFVRAQILEHKTAHPDHDIKRIPLIFRRFLGLPVKIHEVRSVLQAHSSSSAVTLSREASLALRCGSSNGAPPQ